ncbi:complement C1q subcomponent subunit A-like [Thalassophryne amazonica]|uniref:complement C1q subcomponent subunit A-like n=1 Tax=Thalassophryne amazonica TaxID=390379 RepID=UPI0014711FC8|nr:complement C1q subcomponent subunit A-like [Thalassophryne amazonica]
MGVHYWLEILVGVAFLLWRGQCDVSCKGTDGQSGVAGAKGRDGWAGLKGEKGEPAVTSDGPVDPAVLLRLKGVPGSRGLQGVMGPKGYAGELGAAGLPGLPGKPGPSGMSVSQGSGSASHAQSAFSVIRNSTTYPPYNQIVTYERALVNKPKDFNLDTGHFTCSIPGFYYFVFNSASKVSLCLRIASDALVNKLGFCDYKKHHDQFQVMSGGVVLQLTAGQKVWLESFKENQEDSEVRDVREKQIIFNGFLIFQNQQ